MHHQDLSPNRPMKLPRRAVLIAAALAAADFPTWLPTTGHGAEQQRNTGIQTMQQSNVNELIQTGGLLVVAQWEAKEGEAERVADILRRFLPRAQAESGVKLFLIARGKSNPAQFIFYELFEDAAAFAAHQTSGHFKTFIAGEALPLLARRERSEYILL